VAQNRRIVTITLLVGLTVLIVLQGVVPALCRLDADFPSYFTAAKIATEARDTRRLYDDVWFREQIRRYGLESAANPGKFAPFPPPTALLLMPLARFEPLTALRILTIINVLCLICSIFLLARIASWTVTDSAVFVLLSGHAIINGLRFGQPYILASASCILGYYAYLSGRRLIGGMCFGVFAPIKYFPAIILGYLASRREWIVLLGGAITMVGLGLVSIGVLGWPVHRTFLDSVLGSHLTGRLSLQDQGPPFTAVYQSFDTLFDRLFLFDPAENPQPLAAAPLLRTAGIVITKVTLVLAAIAALLELARANLRGTVGASIGVLGILTLLMAPATATYHFTLLWLPIALLVSHFLTQGARIPAYLILGSYALIGLFPYKLTYPFEGHGGRTVLAYPRLLLLLGMFVVCVYYILRQRSSTDNHEFAPE